MVPRSESARHPPMRWGLVVGVLWLAACASAPVAPPPQLFNDPLFRPASEPIRAQDVFAMSSQMQQFLHGEMAGHLLQKGRQQGLFEALYTKSQLKLEYDSEITRNAAQAFEARTGNCLSLVIMTAAFAKEVNVPVRYQIVLVDDQWSRKGDVYFSVGHVNLVLGKMLSVGGIGRNEGDELLIDFLPPKDIRGVHTKRIGEETIIAMYMNNRAVEAFTDGQLDDAYWWARAAIEEDSKFMSSYNTLGVIYQLHGNRPEAERAFRYVLEREPGNTRVMSNLAPMLESMGRVAEANEMIRKMQQLEPYPAFSFFKRGLAAMRDRDYKSARDMFAKEVDRAAYYDEFHFWLAAAYVGLGDYEQARKHLTIAMETSTTRSDHDIYGAKLAWISSHAPVKDKNGLNN
jgi:tetratricopeptide (TPR) repeat protein